MDRRTAFAALLSSQGEDPTPHAIVLRVLLALTAWDGGGGGGEDNALALLAGTWGGPGFDSFFLRITFDGDGTVASVAAGGGATAS